MMRWSALLTIYFALPEMFEFSVIDRLESSTYRSIAFFKIGASSTFWIEVLGILAKSENSVAIFESVSICSIIDSVSLSNFSPHL